MIHRERGDTEMARFNRVLLFFLFVVLTAVSCAPTRPPETAANNNSALSVTPSMRMTSTPEPVGSAAPITISPTVKVMPTSWLPRSRTRLAELQPSAGQPYSRYSFLDVDTGIAPGDSWRDFSAPDVLLMAGNWIQPINGASLAAVGLSEPGLAGCQQQTSYLREPISARAVGTYFCVLTNQERLAQVKIEAVEERTIYLTTTTWADKFPLFVQAVATAVPDMLLIPIPTATFIPDAPIYASGVAVLQPDGSWFPHLDMENELSFLDLDTGLIGPTGADVQFLIEGSGQFQILRPITRTRLVFAGVTEPTVTDCDRALRFRRQMVEQYGVGFYFCVRTDAGRLARLFVEARNNPGFAIRYVTWDTTEG